MPQITLEYTDNLDRLDAGALLRAVNRHLAATGHFDEADIKSRAVPLATYAIGTAEGGRAFAHLRLGLLSGRTPDAKRQLSEGLLDVLAAHCLPHGGLQVQLCAETVDMDRDSYRKRTVG